MTSVTTKPELSQPTTESNSHLFDGWFDPIETGIRDRVRGLIEEMICGELDAVLSRPHYGRRAVAADGSDVAPDVTGHRHGRRVRTLTGTFGKTEIAVPRARLNTAEGKTTEWKSQSLRAYQRRTLAADALIAGTYLAGTNTRRVRRALFALFGGAVGKDTVSRVWRKVKNDWDAWNARSLADEPIVRLILDGTVVRVRLDRKATSISLLVVLGVREDGQKVLLAIKSMGGESTEARQGHRDRLGRRAGPTLHGPQAPEPSGACARAPARGDRRRLQRHDLCGDAAGDRRPPQGLHPQVAAQAPRRRRQPGGSRRPSVHLHPPAAGPMAQRAHDQCDRAAARRVQTKDQDTDRAAICRHRRHAVLGAARLRPDQHAKDRWLADARYKAHRSTD